MPYIHEHYPKGGDKEFLVFAFEDNTVDIDCSQWNGETSVHFKRDEIVSLVCSLQNWLDITQED